MRNDDEFPEGASEWPNDVSRRDFIRLTGASLALASFGACTKQPIEKIVPYVKQQQDVIPGRALRFASATTFNGYAQGVIVTSREGRPIKIEGNPDHSASFGATTIWAQADLLDLYDPDRAQTVMHGQDTSTWEDFLLKLDHIIAGQRSSGGAGIRVLTGNISSPTLWAQLEAVKEKFPAAKLHHWNPIAGVTAPSIHDFTKTKIIVALDSDFLFMDPAALRYARDFASTRRLGDKVSRDDVAMSRLYVAEPTPTITGSNADHRIAVPASDIGLVAQALLSRIGGSPGSVQLPNEVAVFESWISAAANDLAANRGNCAVLAGNTQPPEVHDLVATINAHLGNSELSIRAARIDPVTSLRQLVADMNTGGVELLIILGGNPIYDGPVDLGFGSALTRVKTRVHHTLYHNETSQNCHWLIPASHFLESWSDAVASDGSLSIVQPLIEPLYSGVSAHEVIGSLLERPVRSAYEIVQEHWRSKNGGSNFENDWRRALSDGVVKDLRLNPPQVSLGQVGEGEPARRNGGEPDGKTSEPFNSIEVVFRPDPNVLDGRYANNGWLQELPRPFTKLTWENAALVSPELAARKHLETGDVVELTFRDRKLTAPIFVQPGQAENSVTLHLGYGRKEVGRVGKDAGFNAYAFRESNALWFGSGITIRKTGFKHLFASTQEHHGMEGRELFRSGTVSEFRADPKKISKSGDEPKHDETLYDPNAFTTVGYAWGMVIDLGTCIGCSACVIACQAENNIPVVGKEQVARGREMHWIRIDTYVSDRSGEGTFRHQPVPCMHCEHAPCELVCPVAATVHDAEGLNVQVYNRCVGTRYCSNNCPYKVRRFNFLELNANLSPTEKLIKNPEVTVRSRGVMEKCTYCVQRISSARMTAELESRQIRDGEVVPACAQVCPTEAIVFGDIHDRNSKVARLKRSPLNYSMLAELNTRPRTTYLAKVENPNAHWELENVERNERA